MKSHLVQFPDEAASAVDVDAAVIHDGYDVAPVGAHRCCADAVVTGTKAEELLVRVYVYETHQAVLTQHAEYLQGDEQQSCRTSLMDCVFWCKFLYICDDSDF